MKQQSRFDFYRSLEKGDLYYASVMGNPTPVNRSLILFVSFEPSKSRRDYWKLTFYFVKNDFFTNLLSLEDPCCKFTEKTAEDYCKI